MKALPKHFFVVVANGTSAHRGGPFSSREVAIEWASKNYASWPCWLIPAEYIGSVPVVPLNADGQRVAEG